MNGLDFKDVEYRVNNGLINNEEIKHSRTTKEIILDNTITLFNIINITLLILVLTTGSFSNCTFIISVVFNTIISVYQEIKAKYIIDKLKITTSEKIKVVRDGEIKEILPSEIVIDDLLYLTAGDSLVVDAKVVKSDNLEVDESIISGESNSIIKKEDSKLISGSVIIAGSGYAKVISINRDTYANGLIKEASQIKSESSYIMKNINKILKVVTVFIIPIGLLLFVTQFVYSGQTYSESVLSSVAGVIGMIPDGLVLLTSVSLTIGVIKMANKKVIIQKLSGIEQLACTDFVCLDKTGTITDGSMCVTDVVYLTDDIKKTNNIIAHFGSFQINATNKAINEYFKIDNELEIKKTVPFSSSRKYSLIEFSDSCYALGACEFISRNEIDNFYELNKFVEKGYRIITLVKCKDKFNKENNIIEAFIIIKDNIRSNAKETLDYFKSQDVNVKIISGDNPKTVVNLLKQIDIDMSDKYISGSDLPETLLEMEKIVLKYNIFGRVTPNQKKLIVEALKNYGTVSYIGDGVNDILALKESNCGIALVSGINAARSVSEVVLTDSDFSVIPKIVDEGRRVINNVERVASLFLIKTTYSFLIAILCIFLSYEYPFYPVQLSLISIICVSIPSFFLAIEPNYTKVKKGFLVRVFRNALPSGLCVFLNILFLIMFAYLFKIDFEDIRFVVVAVTGFLNIRLLYNVCKPLNLGRKILLGFSFVAFYLLLFIYKDFFLIKKVLWLPLILSLIMCFTSMYITEFFESAYDKLVIKRYNKKRSRVVDEN